MAEHKCTIPTYNNGNPVCGHKNCEHLQPHEPYTEGDYTCEKDHTCDQTDHPVHCEVVKD